MNITIPMTCEGDYRLVVSKDKECKHIVNETGILPNLVLNSGLDLICEQGITFTNTATGDVSMRVLAVGTSNVPPSPEQTSLGSLVRFVELRSSGTSRSFSTEYERGYIEMKFSRQFPQGAVVGNISEVGCGYAYNRLLSRALVRDNEGNPSTITVLSDEFLTVHYSLRMFFPKEDITQNINVVVDGVDIPTTVTARPSGCNRTIGAITFNQATGFGFLGSGELVSPTAEPIVSMHRKDTSADPYVPGTYRISRVTNYGTSEATWGVLSVFLAQIDAQPFQYLFNPPLTKTGQQTMQIRVGLQIGRPA